MMCLHNLRKGTKTRIAHCTALRQKILDIENLAFSIPSQNRRGNKRAPGIGGTLGYNSDTANKKHYTPHDDGHRKILDQLEDGLRHPLPQWVQ